MLLLNMVFYNDNEEFRISKSKSYFFKRRTFLFKSKLGKNRILIPFSSVLSKRYARQKLAFEK